MVAVLVRTESTPRSDAGPDEPELVVEQSRDWRERWRAIAPDGAVFVAFMVLAAYATWPTVRYLGSRVAHLGDPLENVWIFSWGAHGLAHQPSALFNANIFSPERLTLAYAENVLGVSIPAAPLFWITGNGVLTYNLAMLVVLAVGGFGVYLLVRELGGSRAAAILAGAGFISVPYRLFATDFHPHVAAVHLVPFVLLLLLRLRRGVTLRRVGALALVFALQWWSSLTGGVFTLVAVGVWGLWEAGRLRRRALPLLLGAGAGVAVGMVLSLPVLIPYLLVRQDHPEFSHSPIEPLLYSASPQSYLSPLLPVAGPLRSVAAELGERFADELAPWEKTLFPGFALTGGLAVSLVAAAVSIGRRRREGWVEPVGLFLAIGLAGFVLSLGPRTGGKPDGARLPFALLDELIPGNLLRVPARIGILALLAVPVIVGLAVARLPRRRQTAVVALALGLILVELAPTRRGLVTPPTITAAHRAVSGRSGAVLALPTAEAGADGLFKPGTTDRENIHMYLSTGHFRPLTNGYSAYYPPSYVAMMRAAAALPSAESFGVLRRRDVQTVIVQQDLLPGTGWVGIEERLAAWPGVRELGRSPGVVVFDVSGAETGPQD
jgi:hypothetical protein